MRDSVHSLRLRGWRMQQPQAQRVGWESGHLLRQIRILIWSVADVFLQTSIGGQTAARSNS